MAVTTAVGKSKEAPKATRKPSLEPRKKPVRSPEMQAASVVGKAKGLESKLAKQRASCEDKLKGICSKQEAAKLETAKARKLLLGE